MRNIVPISATQAPRQLRVAYDPLDISAENDLRKNATEFTGLREYLAMAKRRWLLILVVTIASLGYTLNQMRTEKPVYRARSTVRLIDASRAIAGSMGDNTSRSQDMPFSPASDPIQSQIQILQSEAVATLAVEMEGLRLVPAAGSHFPTEMTGVTVADSANTSALNLVFGPDSYNVESNGRTTPVRYGVPVTVDGVGFTVEKRPNMPSSRLTLISKEAAMNGVLGGFNVRGRPRTDILDLSFTSDEPNQAQRVANAMARAYQAHNTQNAQQFSRRRRQFLESQLRHTDSALTAAITAYNSFRANVQGTMTAVQEKTAAITQIDAKRIELESDRQALEAALARTKRGDQNVASSIRGLVASTAAETNAAVQGLFAQLMTQENARDALVDAGAAPTNPDLVKINAQIATTGRRMVDAIQSQLEAVNAQLATLNRQRPSNPPPAAVIASNAETRQAQLETELQSQQRLAGNLREELQKARVSEAVEAGHVEIVQLARYPGFLVAEGKQRELFIAVIVGLMLGFGAAVIIDSLDRSIRKRGDIEPNLGIPGLVVIPRLASAGPNRRGPLKALPSRRLKAASRSDNQMLDLVTMTDPRSPSAEAFRTLRTNLMFSQAVAEMRTLVVTSASPGEGKTVTAANLAVAFAQQGMRVLLVDCDLRRGRLHRVFGLSREPGMSDLVLGYDTEENVTRQTAVAGLYVIPSGKLPPNPAEMLGGPHTKEKLAALTEGYDLVIIDTPPLLAASDAAILSTLSDGVIMVLRAGATETAAAQQSMQQLQAIGARVVGAVLNDPESEVAKYGAYYEYNYAAGKA